jgi:hypothetical protein
MAMMKHVGKVGEKPCVVLFREVPNEQDSCLVIETGGLNSQQHDALMSVIQSPEAQESNEVSEVLNRRQFPDGSNMLTALHYSRKISKVPVSLVKLTPIPNQEIALSDVNAELRKIKNKSNPPLKTEIPPQTVAANPVTVETDTALREVQEVVTAEQSAEAPAPGSHDDVEIARTLIMQAQLLEEDAQGLLRDAENKRTKAYDLAPELQPRRGPGRPPKTSVIV